jgi:hypothetical protein
MKMKKPGATAKISLLMVLAIALSASAYAEQPAAQAMSVAVSKPVPTFTAKCESTLSMDISFTSAWLASHVSAPQAQPANVNTLKLNLEGSSGTALPGYVECFYTSPGKDVYNLVYKFPCKNAKPAAAVANTNTFICTK